MIVRIRLKQGPRIELRPGKNRSIAVAVAAFLTPAALMSCVLAVWRLAADLRIAGEFAITDGFFSRWQVWLAVALLLQFAAWKLNRYGLPEGR